MRRTRRIARQGFAGLLLAVAILLSFASVSSAQSQSQSQSQTPTTPTTPTTRATTTTTTGAAGRTLSETGGDLLLPLAAGAGMLSIVIGMRRASGTRNDG